MPHQHQQRMHLARVPEAIGIRSRVSARFALPVMLGMKSAQLANAATLGRTALVKMYHAVALGRLVHLGEREQHRGAALQFVMRE